MKGRYGEKKFGQMYEKGKRNYRPLTDTNEKWQDG